MEESGHLAIDVDEEDLSFVGTLAVGQAWYKGGFETHDSPACPEIRYAGRLWVPMFTARFPRSDGAGSRNMTFARLKGMRSTVAAFLPDGIEIDQSDIAVVLGFLPLCRRNRRKILMLLVHSQRSIGRGDIVSLQELRNVTVALSIMASSILIPPDNSPLADVAAQYVTNQAKSDTTTVHLFSSMTNCCRWAEEHEKLQRREPEEHFSLSKDCSYMPMRILREQLDLLNEKCPEDPCIAEEIVAFKYVCSDIMPATPRGRVDSVRFFLGSDCTVDESDAPAAAPAWGSSQRTSLMRLDNSEFLDVISEDSEEEEDEKFVPSFKRSKTCRMCTNRARRGIEFGRASKSEGRNR